MVVAVSVNQVKKSKRVTYSTNVYNGSIILGLKPLIWTYILSTSNFNDVFNFLLVYHSFILISIGEIYSHVASVKFSVGAMVCGRRNSHLSVTCTRSKRFRQPSDASATGDTIREFHPLHFLSAWHRFYIHRDMWPLAQTKNNQTTNPFRHLCMSYITAGGQKLC